MSRSPRNEGRSSISATPPRYGSERKSALSSALTGRSRRSNTRAGEEVEYASSKAIKNTLFNRIRINLSPYFAEFLGTAIFILVGCGTNVTYTILTSNQESAWLGSAFGWGLGLMLGVFISGGISGGMLNPVVALAFALFRDLPWIQIPLYFFFEFLGAFVGAILAYICFAHSLDAYDGFDRQINGPLGTAGAFTNFPRPFIGNMAAFLSEAVGTGVLVIGVLAVTDLNNFPGRSCTPIAIGLVLTGDALALGYPTGYSFNPARDLGPRMAAAIWYGGGVFTKHASYTWVPIVAPFVGGIIAATVYELLIVSKRTTLEDDRDSDDHHS